MSNLVMKKRPWGSLKIFVPSERWRTITVQNAGSSSSLLFSREVSQTHLSAECHLRSPLGLSCKFRDYKVSVGTSCLQ